MDLKKRVLQHLPKLSRFDPFQVFEVTHYPCAVLYIKVLSGYNITKGWAGDLMDTPDPYVTLYIKTAPNCLQKTSIKDNDINPVWNETFTFYIDPREHSNRLEISLMDSNYLMDEPLGSQVIDLKELPYQGKEKYTLEFFGTSVVDFELWADMNCEPQLRFSLTLSEEEREFVEKRKMKVFEAMKKYLGKDAPISMQEVPVIGVIGSGGGFRAMTAYSGVFSALVDTNILEMVTYAGGLSGSAWYLSQLYTHPEWPKRSPLDLQEELKSNIDSSPFYLLGPNSMYSYVSRIMEKRRQGQPVSFTDFFGHLVGETLLKNRQHTKLSDQKEKIRNADIPMPLYTCLHVKKSVSAMVFHEWMEFTPFEIGLPKYGTFMKSEHFGSKFFMGQLVKQYPEQPLHFLQGVWGSAFCIQFKRLLKDDKRTDECRIIQEEREELERELLQELDTQTDEESESSETEAEEEERKRKQIQQKGRRKSSVTSVNSRRGSTASINSMKDTDSNKGFIRSMFGKVLDSTGNYLLGSIEGRAAKVHSFMRGLSLYKVYPFSPFTSIDEGAEGMDQFDGIFEMYPTNMKKLYVVDGGLTFNSPFPLLLRPQRQVDLLLSFDFSARQSDSTPPFKEIKLAEKWARLNNVPFPEIDLKRFDREGMKECYVFQNHNDPRCPIVLHFVLANITFRDEKMPGVPRTTEEEKKFADFEIFDDPERPYSTFNFKYTHQAFDRLTQLTEFNTRLHTDLIIAKITECVKKHRNNGPVSRRPIKLKDIKKLRLQKVEEERLKEFVQSFDDGDVPIV
ncbi:cytosolic phospholipase A2-like [Ylistrum balloti]|uniref:cytosolic phospholipase A2-like n=1 Tax=Ylistrum balloti TaxID=509963 RepID=UPI002905BD7F|nr:cytosolic phospholipase A2-like [Ylistrum balloti]